MWFMAVRINGVKTAKKNTDDIDELCKKHTWLRELGREYMV